MQGTENEARSEKLCNGAQKTMQRSEKTMQNVENDAKHGKRDKAKCKTKTKGWATCIGVAASQRSKKMQKTASEAKSAL